jgi:hypothetical protein
MRESSKLIFVRLLPVILVTGAAAVYAGYVEGANAYAMRNIAPMLGVIGLSAVALYLGEGRWQGAGWRWPLGVAGFAIPAIGLSLYLHYGYAVNLDGMFSGTDRAIEVFRWLPIYSTGSGGIGFAIGWIVGSRV